ncbi:formin-binding protein 4 isoform X1 [Hydra vulgaris]|uniref:Formin-binding protein 4 n=1 Tax=Hydra vulgaris TaxID=6087 RepID=T2MA24_HYDVU|nr:formin-binding protein 4 isoform X1 [Hydra vulgaris]
MGKRNKEPNVGRRRPMIQLGGNNWKTSIPSVSRSQIKEQEAAEGQNESKDPMDDELAGFLAEINSLETPQPNIKETYIKEELLYDPNTFNPTTHGHLLPEPWQAIYDDTTSYYYYWNKITNEVQWYPPTATIPPPPPPVVEPPPVFEKQLTISSSINNVKLKPSANNLDMSLSTVSLIPEPVDNNTVLFSSSSTNLSSHTNCSESSDDEQESILKEKDKELMSKIKEKIQKKKEEKRQKQIEEKEALIKKAEEEKLAKEEEEKQRKRKEKEEVLREKLIKKKLEREKTLKNNCTVEKESFSVDIFAAEDISTNKLKVNSPINTESDSKEIICNDSLNKLNVENETLQNDSVECVSSDVNKNDDIVSSQDDSSISTNIQNIVEGSSSKTDADCLVVAIPEVKSSWRIIDAVYDDDDEEEEEDSKVIVKADQKLEVGMEDYADMLLEDGIDDGEINQKKESESVDPFLPQDAPPPLPEHDVRPPLPPEDEPLPELPKLSAKDEENDRKEITSLSKLLFEKLDFLGITTRDLGNLQLNFIELETRIKDWQAGALDSHYFLQRLRDLSVEIKNHEDNAAPTGWICHWSSEYNMYYYHNNATGESQWEYPDQGVALTFPVSDLLQTNMGMITPVSSFLPAQPMIAPPIPPMMMPVPLETMVSKTILPLPSTTQSYSRDSVPITNRKRQGSVEPQVKSSDPYRDPYRTTKKNKVSEVNTNNGNTASSSPMLRDVAEPIVNEYASSLQYENPNLSTQSPQSSTSKKENGTKIKVKKLKSKNKLESSGLPSKKLKQVSSLVHKWQSVKQQAEEEESIELGSSEDDDYEVTAEKRIEEWKQSIEASGQKESNPNFTEIKGDWRERLKRKTAT